jgi:prepilin-type N-terminal cleavage/methylation domain-containing protein
MNRAPGIQLRPAHHARRQHGFTLIELLIALALAAILFAGLNGVVGQALGIHDTVHEKNDLTRQARFAMQRMEQAVGHTRLLLLPLNDKPASNWLENIREETVPPTAPTDDSTKYTAVLAVTLPLYSDLDGDGFPDADDDRDGRVDEDLPADIQHDFGAGIYLIDDDGDGSVDEGSSNVSDDESSTENDDPVNGVDDDSDNNIDEDPARDNNGDGCPGVCGVDDDGDGQVDEASADDDDEEGRVDDDWFNPVVFYLNNGTLMERTPVPWDESGDSSINGRDFIVAPIAENVTRFRVERLPLNGDRHVLVDLTLELTSPVSGETVSLHTRVRVGGAL